MMVNPVVLSKSLTFGEIDIEVVGLLSVKIRETANLDTPFSGTADIPGFP